MAIAITDLLSEIIKTFSGQAKNGLIDQLNTIISLAIKKFRQEGMYEVLAYESNLELLDIKGHKARFYKKEKVKYLQDNIIAFQDQAWGAGKILVDYQCHPGYPVDRYRQGAKIYNLISLREVKSRGDIDEFEIKWKIQKGFLRKTGFWGTDINQATGQVKVQVVFPKFRPPTSASMIEKSRQRVTVLNQNDIKQLPDDRWIVTWEMQKPALHEQYLLCWEW